MNRTLKNVFLEELQEMYDAEHQIIEALPNLIEAATCDELKSVLETHLEETEGQAETLERIFNSFGEKPARTTCEAIAGLIENAEGAIKKNKKSPAINAAIIAAAQKIEHYEIASYGCLKTWAAHLGKPEAANFLESILDEEKGADLTLTELADAKNEEALEEA